MVKMEVLNRQETRYDVVVLMDEKCDSMRSIYEYDCIYTVDTKLGAYRFEEWIVTNIYYSDMLWHDFSKCGEQTYMIKCVKGVEI